VSEEASIEILQIDESVARHQEARLRRVRVERSSDEVRRRLDALRRAADGTDNLMPHIYDAVKAYATLGEICDTLRDAFGTYHEPAIT
jgi:methylmalonyl-CoA mutase N-terminal domain/subunit